MNQYDALWDDLGHLLFEMPESINDLYPFTPRIAHFGHTHQAAFQYHDSGVVETIYANTGTWIDGKSMTWVEVKIEDGESGRRDYTVSLWYYGESSPRQSATGSVQAEPGSGYVIRHR